MLETTSLKKSGVKPGIERVMKNNKWRVSYECCISKEIVTEDFTTAKHILRHPIFSKFFKTNANIRYYSITPEKQRFVKVSKINEPV
jgi:hypothetical protein